MDSSRPHDLDTDQETPYREKGQSSNNPPRSQRRLLILAMLGIIFSGWYAWANRSEIAALCVNQPVVAQAREQEFNVDGLILPKHDVLSGGVPKDGIPALTNPKFVTAAQASYMKPADRLAGVHYEGEARAYPLKILDMHEAVNDQIGETSFVVTYCPLCDSLAVYNRKGPGGEIELGISGSLYNSNVLLYDRTGSGKTDGLWSQMMSQAVSGPRVNEKLVIMPVELTTWQDWKERHPETKVLSINTGFTRNYQKRAYAAYFNSNALMFDVKKQDQRLPNKTPLLGVLVGDQMRAYPVTAFADLTEPQEWEQELSGKKFTLAYHPQAKSLRIVKSDPGVSWMYSFWFAWYAFHPKTEVYVNSQ